MEHNYIFWKWWLCNSSMYIIDFKFNSVYYVNVVLLLFVCIFELYSHSMVAGGFPEISYTTRLTPRTSLIMRNDTRDNNS